MSVAVDYDDQIEATLAAIRAHRPARRDNDLPRFPLDGLELSDGALAARLGVDRGTVWRWRSTGGVDEYLADRIAVEVLGRHPVEVWPEWLTTT